VVKDISTIDMDKVLYVVFDLEAMGRSQDRDKIIKLAAEILDPNRIPLEAAIFSELIRPNTPIPRFITELTTITNNMVGLAERFPEVAGNFLEFMQRHSDKYLVGHDNVCIEHINLVAHNGKLFDIPFLMQ
jgi:DNA polymerase III epsilon subunit-like protein